MDIDNWKFFSENIIEKLQAYHDKDNCVIAVFMNSRGVEVGNERYEQHKAMFEQIVKEISRPIIFIIAVKFDSWMKPSKKMWTFLEENILKTKIDKEKSFFCGDEAGRDKG